MNRRHAHVDAIDLPARVHTTLHANEPSARKDADDGCSLPYLIFPVIL